MIGKRILVIAGSDSSGGAGLEADQKVIASHGCYAMTATTALTAQNTLGVYDIYPIPQEFLKKQLDACFDDVGVDVVKTGMLASAATIQLVAMELRNRSVTKIVIDPVMVATTGASLFASDGIAEFYTLASLALVITPNVSELKLLLECDKSIDSAEDLEQLARQAHKRLGCKWVLAKGGHVPFRNDLTAAKMPQEKKHVVNVLIGPDDRIFRIVSPYQDSRNTHGTGCSLASAIASNLAIGMDVYPAVRAACRYIEAAIQSAPGYGKGYGPLNHFHCTYMLPFSHGHFLDYVLERDDISNVWSHFVDHDFVRALGSGTLPLESFKGYLVQDYLFLVHFARANALAAYKSKNIKEIANEPQSAELVQQLEKEMDLHVQFCSTFGITRQQMDTAEEHIACTAYTRYVLDIGQSEDWFGLQIALLPCMIGYGIAARTIYEDQESSKGEDNPYWSWVETYMADDYVTTMKTMRGMFTTTLRFMRQPRPDNVNTTIDRVEKHAVLQSPSRIEELVRIFRHATQMEIAFWEMYKYK